jgi:hypothetical protein
LSRENVWELLSEYELNHIEKMKNDVEYFKSEIEKDLENYMFLLSDALMLMLLNVNNKMWNTKMVQDYVRDKVDKYKANLRKGHIKTKGSDYAVLFGNPLEMLQYAIEERITKGDIKEEEIKGRPLTGKQVYCSRYEDGDELAGFRYPHITMGNVLVVGNVYKEAFSTYFNLTDNIVISNAYDNDIMYRLQGQDYDSDTILLCPNSVLIKAAKDCQNDNFRVPINKIEVGNKERKYTAEDETDIDHKTAKNKIGEIVNLAQVLNSYYWDYKSKNHDGQYDGLLKEYYKQISALSSLSQIEIDRAKKDYGTGTSKFLIELRKREYDGQPLLKRDKEIFPKDKSSPGKTELLSKLNAFIKRKSFDVMCFMVSWPSIVTLLESENDINQALNIIQGIEKEILDPLQTVPNVLDEFDEPDEMALDEEGIIEKKSLLSSRLSKYSNEDFFIDYDLDITYGETPLKIPLEIPLDEKGKKAVEQLVKFLNSMDEKEVLIRPKFFKFLKYRGEVGKYSFKGFETPMDYLQEIIDSIPSKKRTKTDDIIDIITQKPNFHEANNHQLSNIIKHCTPVSEQIDALRRKKNISKYARISEAEKKVIQKLKGWKINDNTIRIILYRAFSENEKYHDKKYSEMGRHLASWLYQAHPETFKQVIEMSKSK